MVGDERVDLFDATDLATRLVGDAVGTNLFLVGFAWQRGLLPLSFEALDGAIALNGVAVSLNRQAFEWGRRAALDLPAVQAVAQGDRPPHHILSSSLDEEVARRVRSEEHTSELQSLMRISYAVFCLKKKTRRSQP